MHLRFKLATTLSLLFAVSGCLEPAQVTPRSSTPDADMPAIDMSTQDARQDLSPDLSVLDMSQDMTPEDLGPDLRVAEDMSPNDLGPDMPQPPDMATSRAPLIVAAGYGGLIMRSEDEGMTWSQVRVDPWLQEKVDPMCKDPAACDPNDPAYDPATCQPCARRCSGGDDKCLLRDIIYAKGLFVAVGWKILTSPDGLTWTERTVANQQWCGGAAEGAGQLVCAGGCGNVYGAADGLSWAKLSNPTQGCGHIRSLAFGQGVFVATGDNGLAITSPDALSWTPIMQADLGKVIFRDGAFLALSSERNATHSYRSTDGLQWTRVESTFERFFERGVYLRGGRQISRSVDNIDWQRVATDLPHSLQAFAYGYTAP